MCNVLCKHRRRADAFCYLTVKDRIGISHLEFRDSRRSAASSGESLLSFCHLHFDLSMQCFDDRVDANPKRSAFPIARITRHSAPRQWIHSLIARDKISGMIIDDAWGRCAVCIILFAYVMSRMVTRLGISALLRRGWFYEVVYIKPRLVSASDSAMKMKQSFVTRDVSRMFSIAMLALVWRKEKKTVWNLDVESSRYHWLFLARAFFKFFKQSRFQIAFRFSAFIVFGFSC